jgi:hypothetical protein
MNMPPFDRYWWYAKLKRPKRAVTRVKRDEPEKVAVVKL